MHISGRHISLSPRNRLFVRIIAADTARVSPCLFCPHAWSCKAPLDEAVWGQSCSTDTVQSCAADGHVCLTSHRYSDETQRMSVAASSTVVASQHQFFFGFTPDAAVCLYLSCMLLQCTASCCGCARLTLHKCLCMICLRAIYTIQWASVMQRAAVERRQPEGDSVWCVELKWLGRCQI